MAEEEIYTGLQIEPSLNVQRLAEQQAAMKDYERKRPGPGVVITMPNSEFIRVQQAMPGAWYPGEQSNRMLGEPRTIIARPKSDWDVRMPRYIWMMREDSVKHGGTPRHNQTNAYERSGRLRYVEEKEINVNHPDAVYEVYVLGGGIGPDGKPKPEKRLVVSGSMILCEILDPKLSYNKYKAWDDYAISRQMQMPEHLQSTPNFGEGLIGQIPGKTKTRVDDFGSDPKSRVQEGV